MADIADPLKSATTVVIRWPGATVGLLLLSFVSHRARSFVAGVVFFFN